MIPYVQDTSGWEEWQRGYKYGMILIIPPSNVLSQIEPLRQKYDYRSFVSYPTHITVSDPLCREMTPELFSEIQDALCSVNPFTLYYDEPCASREHAGVMYPIRPQKPIEELKKILHSSSGFSMEAYNRRSIAAHITIAEFVSIEESFNICNEIIKTAPSGSFLCDRLELIVPDENFQFKKRGTFFFKQVTQ